MENPDSGRRTPTPSRQIESPGPSRAPRGPQARRRPPRRPDTWFERLVSNRRDPYRRHREIRGGRAKIRWWHRLRAAVGLLFLAVLLGFVLAVLVAVIFFAGTFVLETVS